jgi:subtilisin family serine protease
MNIFCEKGFPGKIAGGISTGGNKKMKQKKNIYLIFTILILFAAVGWSGNGFAGEKSLEYKNLMNIARTNGFARVIIEFDVPDIDRLTQESTRYQTGCSDEAYILAASAADIELEKAISSAADQLIFELKDKTYKINHTYATLPCLALNLSPEALVALENLPQVLWIAEDKLHPLPDFDRNETKIDISRPLLNDSTKIVGADTAWGMGYTGDGWYVAILDSGILPTHEMFTGKNIVEQCYSLLGDCPNGQTSMSGPGAAAHVMDGESHGTHVAGIAAGNNKHNMSGVAKDADIIAVQIFSYIPAWNDIGSYDSDQLKGLEFVYQKRNQYKIAAINMSLGGGEYFAPCDNDNHQMKVVIDNLKAAGIATAIASGNNGSCGSIDAPACISSAVAVSGTDKQDNHWMWANWHPTMVLLMAPGAQIVSSITDSSTSYASYSGTSMSTPHVTGAWAIMKQFGPSLSFAKILKALQDEGKKITTHCSSTTKTPRINIGAAIQSLLSLAPPLNFVGVQQANRSLLQTEYLNVLTWQKNPLNDQNNQVIVKYRIYTIDSSDNLTSLAEVDAATFEYLHRKLMKDAEYKYAIKSVNNKGEESSSAYVAVTPL